MGLARHVAARRNERDVPGDGWGLREGEPGLDLERKHLDRIRQLMEWFIEFGADHRLETFVSQQQRGSVAIAVWTPLHDRVAVRVRYSLDGPVLQGINR